MGERIENNLRDELAEAKVRVAVLEERQLKDAAAVAQALELQAREYQRRLDALNVEAERLRNVQSSYLPREVFDVSHALTEIKIDSLARLVWMCIGGLVVIEVLLRFIVK